MVRNAHVTDVTRADEPIVGRDRVVGAVNDTPTIARRCLAVLLVDGRVGDVVVVVDERAASSRRARGRAGVVMKITSRIKLPAQNPSFPIQVHRIKLS